MMMVDDDRLGKLLRGVWEGFLATLEMSFPFVEVDTISLRRVSSIYLRSFQHGKQHRLYSELRGK